MMSTTFSTAGCEDLAFLGRYNFDQACVEGSLDGGMFSRPVLISTDIGKFLLRKHTFRSSQESFRFQAEVIQWAFDRGVSCSTVLRTSEGGWCVDLPESRGVLAVHRFISGNSLDWLAWHRRKEIEAAFLHKLGQKVAQLHNQLASARPGGDPELSLSLPTIQFDRLHEIHHHWQKSIEALQNREEVECVKARSRMLSLVPRIHNHWEQLLSGVARHQLDRLPRQIVHGDISAVNLVFEPGDHVAFIDWDCVHFGYRLYDALGDVLNRPPHEYPELNKFRKDHIKAYLKGYSSASKQPLSNHELELVPMFCLARQLEDLRQRIQVLPKLGVEQDESYTRLIQMRVEMMDQIDFV